MISAQGVLKAGVRGAGIDQKAVTDLADVSEALNGGSVEGQQGCTIETNVVPKGVADDFAGAAGQQVSQ